MFRWPLSERLVFTQDRETHIANDFVYLRQKFKRLPAIHLATLRGASPRRSRCRVSLALIACSRPPAAVIFHLRSVALADNKMDGARLPFARPFSCFACR